MQACLSAFLPGSNKKSMAALAGIVLMLRIDEGDFELQLTVGGLEEAVNWLMVAQHTEHSQEWNRSTPSFSS